MALDPNSLDNRIANLALDIQLRELQQGREICFELAAARAAKEMRQKKIAGRKIKLF